MEIEDSEYPSLAEVAEVISIWKQRFLVCQSSGFSPSSLGRLNEYRGERKKCGYFEKEESYGLPSCSDSSRKTTSRVSLYFLHMLAHVFLKVVQSLQPCLFLVIFHQSYFFLALFLNSWISEILMDQQITEPIHAHSGVSVEYL